MVLSMTGYGRAQQVVHGCDVTVELKSVNSRYFEYNSRMPRSCAFLDDKLKKLLTASVSRGKLELGLTVQSIETADTEITANLGAAKGYLSAIAAISTEFGLKNDITADTLARFPDIFILRRAEQDEQRLWEDVKTVAEQAISHYNAMRGVEGEKLKDDILSRLCSVEAAVTLVEDTSAERVQKYTEKLFARLQELLNHTNIDENRILTEAALFADKTAVDEETVRLRSHIRQYRDILAGGGPVGRKLEFLTQELNREVNTIGSKCNELSITRTVVEMKAELEKIREQIQNLE